MAVYESMDELVYQLVDCGNVEGIKALVREGAGLEYVDNEGRTPLILACSSPDLFHAAEALIKLGANVNAYRPGRHGGTPLHHAAGLGIGKTVSLLLDHTEYPFLMNDDRETALDLGRQRGRALVVRLIETAQPIIALRDVYIEEPDTSHADPALIILDNATNTRYTFFSKNKGDKQQVQRFYKECKGILPVITLISYLEPSKLVNR
ncbi:hypothetical protein J5N97_028855 [Dioscorea zingiberensis]|uniref:Uncharacterized protein n=1 Tax=Dioscorea zingiberensis TaxID=325984 RepID=A0A9D5BZT3_9LILI|nr:hypothetical protein J5N97_028855 [Dioscorea zingiberensis]